MYIRPVLPLQTHKQSSNMTPNVVRHGSVLPDIVLNIIEHY